VTVDVTGAILDKTYWQEVPVGPGSSRSSAPVSEAFLAPAAGVHKAPKVFSFSGHRRRRRAPDNCAKLLEKQTFPAALARTVLMYRHSRGPVTSTEKLES
jgi:hypothetical protein